jgi:hypothetical protein
MKPLIEGEPLYKGEFSEGIIYQVKYVWMNILIIARHIKKKAT